MGSVRYKLLLLAVVPTLLAVFVVGGAFAAIAAAMVAFSMALPIAHTMVAQLRQLIAQQMERAADEQRLVLDHVNQGLFMVTYDGRLVGERSRATETLLGPIESHELPAIVRRHDERTASGLEIAFVQLAADVLPLEVALYQMPRELVAHGKTLAFGYTPCVDSTDPRSQRLLVTSLRRFRTSRTPRWLT